ncbi:MAG: Gfo/Idh/MocA family oxidoreductase [Stappiaceae bacterium]
MMDRNLKIGVVGCGNISETYLTNASLFPGADIQFCADLSEDRARTCADRFGIESLSLGQIFDHPDVDVMINLTVPSAHFEVTKRALDAGKHVYSEKPLAVTLEQGVSLHRHAQESNLRLAIAPDTFLGAAGQKARRLIDQGQIGEVIIGTALMFSKGMEHVHPAPQFYYQDGAGPVMDMGPYYLTMLVSLLGPIKRVLAMAREGETSRKITAEGPTFGHAFKAEVPTSHLSLLEFHSGAQIVFGASWDVHGHSNAHIELHGTKGTLKLPDPDTFGGSVHLASFTGGWREFDTENMDLGGINWPPQNPSIANYRFAGLADMVCAIRENRPARTDCSLGLHILEAMTAINKACGTGAEVCLTTLVKRPAAIEGFEDWLPQKMR